MQRNTVERIARAKGIEIDETVEEYDISGVRRVQDRELARRLMLGLR